MRATALDHDRQFLDGEAHRAARAGRVLEQQPGAVAGELEHSLEHGRGALEARVEATAEMRAEVDDNGQRPQAARRAQCLREHRLGALDGEWIGAREVDQVRRVAHGDELGLGGLLRKRARSSSECTAGFHTRGLCGNTWSERQPISVARPIAW